MGDRIALLADVHIGNHKTLGGDSVSRMNSRCREVIRILQAAASRAKAEGCRALAILGDLFDTDDPHPAMVRETLRALKSGPDRVILLLGNHEMHSNQKNDHALASMHGVWDGVRVSVIDTPTVCLVGDLSLAAVPYQPGRAEEWLPGAIKSLGALRRPDSLLCLHLGISDYETQESEPWMMGSHDQVTVDTLQELIDDFSLGGVAAGNWHQHMMWYADNGEEILQLGALVPTGWNNQGGDDLYGTLAIWDGFEFERIMIPGPRYLKFGSVKEWLPYAGREDIRARIVVPASRINMARSMVEAEGPMGYVEVLADKETTHKRVRSAALAARAAADDESAMAAFIDHMPRPDGVAPGEVLEKVKGYLKRARS